PNFDPSQASMLSLFYMTPFSPWPIIYLLEKFGAKANHPAILGQLLSFIVRSNSVEENYWKLLDLLVLHSGPVKMSHLASTIEKMS
ncbi:hypothetical protein OFO30_35405, partial [Escherichia coli]|nr:hypothetical protein [Escherichia coli]